MTFHSYQIIKPSLYTLLLLVMITTSCKQSSQNSKSFNGDQKAIQMAEEMFEAIGGKAAWCELSSLYIKAEHTEPQMTIPYQSEIWRAVDKFEIVIEQQNDSFHVKGVFNAFGGTVRYYDNRDTVRLLTEEQLEGWKFDHDHNIYVLLHDLGCSPELFDAKLDSEDRLSFYQDTAFVTSFELDEKNRPYKFYCPNLDGTVSGSTFTHWGTDHGLVHSAGGHPLDSNFMYLTDIWEPSTKSLKETFGESIFNISY